METTMARRLVYDLFHWLDNTLYGDNEARGDEIRGGDGNDKLFGLDGDDLLLGGAGGDDLSGGEGNDILRGGDGADILFMDRGNNTFDGGADGDTVDFRSVRVVQGGILGGGTYETGQSLVGFSVDLESGVTRASTLGSDAFTDFFGTNTFDSIEAYYLTNRNDVLRGDATSDYILGQGGDDLIEGRGGGDYIHGGPGINTASYESSAQAVDVDLSRSGTGVQLGGDAAGDTLYLVQNVIGSAHNDLLVGDGNANRLEGGGGADEITGGGGRDVLRGGADSDLFIYRSASDSVGTFNQRDVIEDFQRHLPGVKAVADTIDLHAIDAISGQGRNENFDFIGSAAFTGAGQVRVIQAQDAEGRNFSLVQAEVNGDGVADLALTVFTNDNALVTAADFVL